MNDMNFSTEVRAYLKSLTVLFVEDEADVREQSRQFLSRLVGVLITAENGSEGLAAYREQKPDIIVTDIQMPVMDGLAMLQEIRSVDTWVPVIMLTAFEATDYLKRSINLGVSGYVIKPIEIAKFIESLLKCARSLLVEKKMLAAETQQKIEAQNAREVSEAAMELRIAEEVRKNREKDILLLQQDKLASIGHLAAGVAHEINNPIAFITSNLGTLQKYVTLEQRYRHALEDALKTHCPGEEIKKLEELHRQLDLPFIQVDIPVLISESQEGAERVKRIVLDLKDFARTDEDQMKETDLNHCVMSTINIVRNEIRYVAELELQLNEIPTIVCNAQQINQVIANLLVNAAHAIEGRGMITVRTSTEPGQVIMTVTDTGCGIPAEIRNRIFDPFFTTKEVSKGTGLGLSISYDIIRKHGGVITVESEPGVGTTFMVRLPIKEKAEV